MEFQLSYFKFTWVRSLGWEYPLEKEMAVHSRTIAWKIPWTEEPGRLQSMGSQRVGHDWATSLHFTSKDDAVKVLHSICQQIWNTQQWPQDWERSVFIPVPKKGNSKECSNYWAVVLISHVSKVMLRILQAKLQQYMNWKVQMCELDLEKTEEPEIKLPISIRS